MPAASLFCMPLHLIASATCPDKTTLSAFQATTYLFQERRRDREIDISVEENLAKTSSHKARSTVRELQEVCVGNKKIHCKGAACSKAPQAVQDDKLWNC